MAIFPSISLQNSVAKWLTTAVVGCSFSSALALAQVQTTNVSVVARGQLARNVGPVMEVRVNGTVVGRLEVRDTTYKNYTFAASTPEGARVDVVFVNDYYRRGGEDRNLYIESITVNGKLIAPNATGITYDRGRGGHAFDGINVIAGRSEMNSAGALRLLAPAPGQLFGNNSLDILILGSSKSINYSFPAEKVFSTKGIASELANILKADPTLSGKVNINVVEKDVYAERLVSTSVGSGSTGTDLMHYRHSLAQYYHWPTDKGQRMHDFMGKAGTAWDYVIILEDPYIISKIPGYYALGVNKIAAKVVEGGAKPLLVMQWRAATNEEIPHFADVTYRTADGAKVPVRVVPTALAWNSLLPVEKGAASATHPSPTGAYLAAAGIYSEIMNKQASTSSLATKAWNTKVQEDAKVRNFSVATNPFTFVSPFKAGGIVDRTLNFSETGSSSEDGIRAAFIPLVLETGSTAVVGGGAPIEFNFGRGNTYFEANKRYKIDPAKYKFGLGFPIQDAGKGSGKNSMLHGIDRRDGWQYPFDTGVDLGLALWQVNNVGQLPYARTLPIRTIYAEMVDLKPDYIGHSDGWHLSSTTNRAISAYMYTLLTSRCAFDPEPSQTLNGGADWLKWMSKKVGHETAWTLTTLKGTAAECVR